MHWLAPITNLPKEVLIAIGVVVGVFALWIWGRFARRRYLVIAPSPAIDQIAVQLSRIADGLERLYFRPETRPPAATDDTPARHVSMSMLGR